TPHTLRGLRSTDRSPMSPSHSSRTSRPGARIAAPWPRGCGVTTGSKTKTSSSSISLRNPHPRSSNWRALSRSTAWARPALSQTQPVDTPVWSRRTSSCSGTRSRREWARQRLARAPTALRRAAPWPSLRPALRARWVFRRAGGVDGVRAGAGRGEQLVPGAYVVRDGSEEETDQPGEVRAPQRVRDRADVDRRVVHERELDPDGQRVHDDRVPVDLAVDAVF